MEDQTQVEKSGSLRAVVSLLRRRINREWKQVAQERINAELDARSGDEHAARTRLDFLSGYIRALKDVKQANEGGQRRYDRGAQRSN